jgi:hypothetical protein
MICSTTFLIGPRNSPIPPVPDPNNGAVHADQAAGPPSSGRLSCRIEPRPSGSRAHFAALRRAGCVPALRSWSPRRLRKVADRIGVRPRQVADELTAIGRSVGPFAQPHLAMSYRVPRSRCWVPDVELNVHRIRA